MGHWLPWLQQQYWTRVSVFIFNYRIVLSLKILWFLRFVSLIEYSNKNPSNIPNHQRILEGHIDSFKWPCSGAGGCGLWFHYNDLKTMLSWTGYEFWFLYEKMKTNQEWMTCEESFYPKLLIRISWNVWILGFTWLVIMNIMLCVHIRLFTVA